MIYNPTISQQVQDLNKAMFEACKKNGTQCDFSTLIMGTTFFQLSNSWNRYFAFYVRVEDKYYGQICANFYGQGMDNAPTIARFETGPTSSLQTRGILLFNFVINPTGTFIGAVSSYRILNETGDVPAVSDYDMEAYYIIADTYEELMAQLNA